jgi:hypothetical protein
MHVKLTNGQPDQFPYSVGQFRRDNPNTSFPKIIPDTMLRRHGVYPVEELEKPAYDPLVQSLTRDEMPHKEVIRLKTQEDATDPFTGEVDQSQVGEPIYGNRWLIGYTVEDKPLTVAKDNIRKERDTLLSETDWVIVMHTEKGTNIPLDWEMYRQGLRDITEQVGFPYTVEWPTKPE